MKKALTTRDAVLLTFPIHGEWKCRSEGYRTRDGHMTEWAGRLLAGKGEVLTVSRPEPPLRRALRSRRAGRRRPPAVNTRSIEPTAWAIPRAQDRSRWWIDSARWYPAIDESNTSPIIVWNPLVARANSFRNLLARQPQRRVIFDLLDDWTIHYAFESIREEVEEAYRYLFGVAHLVSANAEGTLRLAQRLGRTDAVLLPNGCDPGRFSPHADNRSNAMLTVGYLGKMGNRLDGDGIRQTIRAVPEARFVFAGPVLDGEWSDLERDFPNVQMRGDVHYDDVPELLSQWDVGWVPHRVGKGEVGGDVMKTYEYRAAGLPVLSTPIEGAVSRGLAHVEVQPLSEHAKHLRQHVAGGRAERHEEVFPEELTWEYKTKFLLSAVGLRASS